MLKRTKKLAKNFLILIKLWTKQLQKSKDISERNKKEKRKKKKMLKK